MSVDNEIDDIFGDGSTKKDEPSSSETENVVVKTKKDKKENKHTKLDSADKWAQFDDMAKQYDVTYKSLGKINHITMLEEVRNTQFSIRAEANDIFEFNSIIQECQAVRDRLSELYIRVHPAAEIVDKALKTLLIYGQKFSDETSEKKREADVIDRLQTIGLGYLISEAEKLSMLSDSIQWKYRHLSGAHETISRQITIWQERGKNDIHRPVKSKYNEHSHGNSSDHNVHSQESSPLEKLGKINSNKPIYNSDAKEQPGIESWIS